jgi:cytochrome c oxidase subunit II
MAKRTKSHGRSRSQRARADTSHGPRRKAAAFGMVALAVLGVAITLFAWPYLEERRVERAYVQENVIKISMSGWQPDRVYAKAGEPVTITMVNLDSRFHLDAYGWHDFNIDELQIQRLVGPKETLTFTLTVTEPGEYTFYCSTCCGGKASPSMRGTLLVS